ncbi:Protein SDS23 [Pseudocercospora fuligena]|uniref:Protein SDS23 n=1 Tax=Pseudocercospora fuligena TaxID=685502 RepID=A0A8H6VIB8_9PEZI|nr:Protein SDS23 [Pseudocercospora fuligena]
MAEPGNSRSSRPGSAAGSANVLSPKSQSPSLSKRSPVIRPQNISTSAISSTTTTPLPTPRKESSSLTPSPSVSKRSSFAENLNHRPHPASPRAQRTQSFSGAALTELLMHPTKKNHGSDPRFKGRDWRTIEIHEIVDTEEARFVELETSIEDTTKLLIRSGAPNVVLVRESHKTKTALSTFDFSDLNAYLLLVLGLSQPDEAAAELADRARRGDVIPLKDVQDHLGPREEPVFLPHTANLSAAMEVLGTGHHRVVITKEGSTEAISVLSQLRLVRFFWDNHENFAATEALYSVTLKDLDLGAKEVLAINGDKPVADALKLMHSEGVTSLPVLDSHRNVVGNISHVDVRLLTDTSALPLLHSTCIHFIGVILSERGMYDGKDSYPVFHVTPFSTLAHTVAKLCATRSHRMWIVDAPSPNTSVPPSPGPKHAVPPFGVHTNTKSDDGVHVPQHNTPATTPVRSNSINESMTPVPPYTSAVPGVSIGAGQLPGAAMSGRLSGVVSLTDILNLFARASGLKPGDPEETRRRRRQSSSSSIRPSMDSVRPSMEELSRSVELGRANSASHSRERIAR